METTILKCQGHLALSTCSSWPYTFVTIDNVYLMVCVAYIKCLILKNASFVFCHGSKAIENPRDGIVFILFAAMELSFAWILSFIANVMCIAQS